MSVGSHDFQRDIDAIGASDAVPTILETVSLSTGMGFAAVARVTDSRWVTCRAVDHIHFGLNPGDELEVESTLCHEVRQSDNEIVIADVQTDTHYCHHHTPARYGFRSYISVPIYRSDGSFFGTLCAIDPEPRDLNDPRVLNMFRLFARSIGDSLESGERLQLAEQRLAEEKDLTRLQEEFVAILGHDLRNPIAAMGAGLRMLSRRPLDEQSVDLVGHMQASLHRMSGLVGNILDHTRVRLTGGIGVERETCDDLGQTLEHVVHEVRAVSVSHSFDVNIEVGDPVYCDKDRLGQLLSNLLSNAVLHGDGGEPITINARAEDGELFVSVGNGGEPIPPATQEKLFAPFSRGDATSPYSGLGLGLHIAAQIAKGHEGQIDVHSDADGTRFTLRMPVQPG
ncbi:GAF domain-containing sensor histidine kinase [Pelagovum pacificum]|uniref:histidine kinase n=1 Tax=Pelagovum pacificum TaxID=2588711 RepID=A0A5C5GHL8_9RHOB|nr:GAF domain-containing sensor histidine kinase [Pelagovum pacificum]QQA43256.1 GAF domain-containing sensor histidine kinase [Pelagovum pacificum]TNY33607.1 GAF domain-containing sensor histidine kinase [Pelagovum pacificum]